MTLITPFASGMAIGALRLDIELFLQTYAERPFDYLDILQILQNLAFS